MRRDPALKALALGFALLLPLCGAAAENPPLVEDAVVPWSSSAPGFGSFSGLALDPDGARFVTVSDKGHIFTGRLIRQDGRLVDVELGTGNRLHDPAGLPVEGHDVDAEGIAYGPDGMLYVSFEGNHRVWGYTDIAGPAKTLPQPAAFRALQNNSGLEALFTRPDGALYAIPERSGKLDRPFPVYRYRDGAWAEAFPLRRRPPHLVTGADMGPDGRLYLLERHFAGFLGFSTRIRSFAITPEGVSDERVLLESRLRAYDNLEGIAVWRDGEGRIRVTTISDDNESFFQRTEVVEFILSPRPVRRPYPRPE